jgi:hypothetical protein
VRSKATFWGFLTEQVFSRENPWAKHYVCTLFYIKALITFPQIFFLLPKLIAWNESIMVRQPSKYQKKRLTFEYSTDFFLFSGYEVTLFLISWSFSIHFGPFWVRLKDEF